MKRLSLPLLATAVVESKKWPPISGPTIAPTALQDCARLMRVGPVIVNGQNYAVTFALVSTLFFL